MGQAPEWAGKPKRSPLDHDEAVQKLRQRIISDDIPVEGAGVYIHEAEDGKRLAAKNPARMVRDHVNRFLKEHKLDKSYRVTCRQTTEDKVWAVWLTRLA
jgi:hypothetical protein